MPECELATLLLELATFSRGTALVSPWLWGVRVVGYLGFATPGVLVSPSLMPPLLPSIGFGIAGLLNVVALTSGALPTARCASTVSVSVWEVPRHYL